MSGVQLMGFIRENEVVFGLVPEGVSIDIEEGSNLRFLGLPSRSVVFDDDDLGLELAERSPYPNFRSFGVYGEQIDLFYPYVDADEIQTENGDGYDLPLLSVQSGKPPVHLIYEKGTYAPRIPHGTTKRRRHSVGLAPSRKERISLNQIATPSQVFKEVCV